MLAPLLSDCFSAPDAAILIMVNALSLCRNPEGRLCACNPNTGVVYNGFCSDKNKLCPEDMRDGLKVNTNLHYASVQAHVNQEREEMSLHGVPSSPAEKN
jgi:hypothetical protein